MIIRAYLRKSPASGGMENHISMLTAIQRSINLKVLHLFNDGHCGHKDDIRILPRTILYPRYNRKFALLLFNILCLKQLLNNIRDTKILHTHGDYESLVLILFFKLFNDKKLIHTFHNDISRDKGVKKFLRKIVIELCDVVINVNSVSHTMSSAKSIFFPSPLPKKDKEINFIVRPFIKKVVCVSNVLPVKNLIMLKKVAEKNRHIHFDHYGAGDMTSYLTDNVNSLGVISRNELISRLAEYDLLIHFALYEGTPSVMIEAASIGLPILGPKVSGLEDLFTSCVFVNPNSVESYTHALVEMNDICLRKNISNHLLQDWIDYTWEEMYNIKLSHHFE